MGEAESWDELLETATTALDRLASGRSGEFWLRSGTWHARLRATRKTVNTHIQFGGAAPGIRLNDYQLVLLYGVNYTSSAGAYPSAFAKTLSLQDGYQWDEQSLREVVLEVLGLLRYALAVPADGLSTQDVSRDDPRGLARARLPKRRR